LTSCLCTIAAVDSMIPFTPLSAYF